MKCPTCSSEMRPLLTSMYCPNEERHGKARRKFYEVVEGGPPIGTPIIKDGGSYVCYVNGTEFRWNDDDTTWTITTPWVLVLG